MDPLPTVTELMEAVLLHEFAGDFLPRIFPDMERLPGLEGLGSLLESWLTGGVRCV